MSDTSDLSSKLLNAVRGHPLAGIRRSHGTQHRLAEKMGITQSHVAEREALAHDAMALGGRLRQTIRFDDGDIAVVE